MGGNKKPDKHYPTMKTEDVMALPVSEIADDNSVLYLWTTIGHLDEGIDVLRSWGFKYKTNVVWDKQSICTGYWFRGQHEHLLVGTKGGGLAPKLGTQHSSVLYCKKGKHSSKPLQVRHIIEKNHPDTTKIELFARPNILDYDRGWDFWGNEV